ncbi:MULTISPECIES: tRNA-dependent cyclodipeptide synthase [Nostoc]|uniref:Cyclodipeptide synthase n=1 Tax=Nostoc paludosum FACHB-159 TaxID=2692908 RepID=A0ABR8K8N0_9NOSO|nr:MULTISPECIES: tRNA-dependent cyclodipeptide synthase [Nostoc]MBD2678593.1 tRNA-dependent cyclodipeptide synthase [Nostoc sp. FACHB-857]MBD2734640.1 tRNA-dependent cyclodipeptide synthase [Nostoc paludosum FACHB-159]
MSIEQLQEFLNFHKIKYKTIHYSPAHTSQELTIYKHTLGIDLIESVLVEIDGQKIAVILLPASLQANVGSLQAALDTNKVRLLQQEEFEHLFPYCEFGTLPPFGEFYNMEVFWWQDLAKNQEVAFYAYSYAHLVRMKYADFEKLINPHKGIVFLTRPKYRVEIAAVIPQFARHKLDIYEHCFLGISLESENFSIARLIGMTDWISKHFKKCTVLIGDSIHRITLQINQGLNEKQSLNKGLFLGREYVYNANYVFGNYNVSCLFNVIFCSEIQKSEDYFKYYEQLQNILRQNDNFANSVKFSVKEFVLRHFEKNTENFDSYIELSSRYLLEELAIFACLVKDDLSIMIYPGSLLKILEEIAEGHYSDVPDSLKKIVHVSLHLKRR